MDTEADKEFDWARAEMNELVARVRCCMLATVSPSGKPLSSYAPVLVADDFRLYIYVSGVAKHYGHLRKTGLASVSFIDDESSSSEIFARKRLTVDCAAELIVRGSQEWETRIEQMESRLGGTMGYLKDLMDFDLFRLAPREGRLVLGFGKAYRISGDGLANIGYIGTGGHRAKC